MTRKELKAEVKRCYDEAIKSNYEVELEIPGWDHATMRSSEWLLQGRMLTLDVGPVWLCVKTWEFSRTHLINTFTDFLEMLI